MPAYGEVLKESYREIWHAVVPWVGEAGQIVELRVMLRPLKAVNLIHQKMAGALTARREK